MFFQGQYLMDFKLSIVVEFVAVLDVFETLYVHLRQMFWILIFLNNLTTIYLFALEFRNVFLQHSLIHVVFRLF